MSAGRNVGVSWPMIVIALALGLILVGLANVDRVIWSWTSHGETVPGRVLDVTSVRTSRDATDLTFVPRVRFTDPGGQEREMSVAQGSRRYDFRNGDRVNVLWRAESQTIAIDLPFRRDFTMSILLWGLTLLGLALVGLGLLLWLNKWRAHRRQR